MLQGDVLTENVHNSYIRSEGPLVATVGLDNVIVVATDDAVLVADANSAAEVTGIVARLRGQNRPESQQHVTCHRPWGHYSTVDIGERFQVKRITVKPGAKLSLQKHYHRAEHWVVVRGTAIVQRDEERMLVRENKSVYIPIGVHHRLENPGKLPLQLIEVQSGAYLGEDDIVRVSDSYGRPRRSGDHNVPESDRTRCRRARRDRRFITMGEDMSAEPSTISFLRRRGLLTAFVALAACDGDTTRSSRRKACSLRRPTRGAGLRPSMADAPGTAAGKDPDYKLGANDRLRITVFGQPTLTANPPSTAMASGVPLIGNVPANGVTTSELQKAIAAKLEPDYLVNPQCQRRSDHPPPLSS